MKATDDYAKLTAWMLTVITNPRGVQVGAQVAADQQLLAGPIEAVVRPSRRLSSSARLAIYQGAYYARLLECFRAEYPVLSQLLGAEIFAAFVVDYLQAYPSRSYTLNQLGAQFPAYLAQTQPASTTANAQQASWITLIIELAHLERAYTEVYDGPGHEKEVLPNANAILPYDLDAFLALKLVPTASLRLFAFQHQLLDYFLAARQGLLPEQLPPPQPTWLALIRQQYQLRFFKLSAADHQLLQAVFQGSTIGQALALDPAAPTATEESVLLALRSRICILADEGFFKEIVREPFF